METKIIISWYEKYPEEPIPDMLVCSKLSQMLLTRATRLEQLNNRYDPKVKTEIGRKRRLERIKDYRQAASVLNDRANRLMKVRNSVKL